MTNPAIWADAWTRLHAILAARMRRQNTVQLARALAAASLTSALLLGAAACGGSQQPAITDPTPSPEPALIPSPTPTPDAQTAVRDACGNLLGDVPYDLTYTASFHYREGTTDSREYDVRINERGDYHAIVTLVQPDAQDTESARRSAEEISIDGSAYSRAWPEGAWQESAMVGEPLRVEGLCSTEFASEDEEFNKLMEQYQVTTSYTDLGSTTVNGVEMRHIRLSTHIDRDESDSGTLESPGPDLSKLVEEFVDEFWVTPGGQIAHFRQAYSAGGTAIEVLGVISGLGEPNAIEAPSLLNWTPVPGQTAESPMPLATPTPTARPSANWTPGPDQTPESPALMARSVEEYATLLECDKYPLDLGATYSEAAAAISGIIAAMEAVVPPPEVAEFHESTLLVMVTSRAILELRPPDEAVDPSAWMHVADLEEAEISDVVQRMDADTVAILANAGCIREPAGSQQGNDGR